MSSASTATALCEAVKEGKIKNIDEVILEYKILEPEIIEVSAKFESFFEGNSEYVYIGEKSEGDTILGIKNINEVDVILNDISVIDNPGRKLLKINDGFILRDNIKNSEYSNYYYIVAPYELKISKDNLQR